MFYWGKALSLMMLILISVAFLMVAESKMLGSMQKSRGPNVVGWSGFMQSFADAMKLFTEEVFMLNQANMGLFFFVAMFALSIAFMPWGVLPLNFSYMDFNLGVLYMIFFSSISVYAILMSGWVSNSKYAYDGAMSGSAQMMSYEVSMGLLFLSVILSCESLNLSEISFMQEGVWLGLPLFPMMVLFFISALAETNRVPFDLVEGESELVSGFNVEYRSFLFAMFFLAEYIHMLFISMLGCVLFIGGQYMIMKGVGIVFWFIWVRGTLPRISYDKLMDLCWKGFLPLSLGSLVLMVGLLLNN